MKIALLTPSLPQSRLKKTAIKVWNWKSFILFCIIVCERVFIKMVSIERRCVTNQKIYCLQAHVCTFQPGNFTGWGSEGVNVSLSHTLHPHTYLHMCWCIICVFSLFWKSESKKNCHCKNSKIFLASLTYFKLIAWHCCRFSFLFLYYSTMNWVGSIWLSNTSEA